MVAACAPATVHVSGPAPTTTVRSPIAPLAVAPPQIINAIRLDRAEVDARARYEQFTRLHDGCWLVPTHCHRGALAQVVFSPSRVLAEIDRRVERGEFGQNNPNPDLDYEVIETIKLDDLATVAVITSCRVDGALMFTEEPTSGSGVVVDDVGIFGYRLRSEMRRDEADNWRLWTQDTIEAFDASVENRCPPRADSQ